MAIALCLGVESIAQAFARSGHPPSVLWTALVSKRLAAVLPQLQDPPRGVLQFEVSGRTFALILEGAAHRWVEGISSPVQAWITGTEGAFAALFDGPDDFAEPPPPLTIDGDAALAFNVFGALSQARPSTTLLGLRRSAP